MTSRAALTRRSAARRWLIERAQRAFRLLECTARHRQFRLRRETQRQRFMQACLDLHDRSSPAASSRSSSARRPVSCSRCSLMRLRPTAIELARPNGATRPAPAGRAPPLAPPAPRRAAALRAAAPLLALTLERALALLELGRQCLRTPQLRRGPCEHLLARRALVRHGADILPQPRSHRKLDSWARARPASSRPRRPACF